MSRDVRLVQTWYPQIYLACHTRHVHRASSTTRLSAADSSLLAHLDVTRPITAGQLARHLGVGKSTLSAALKRLVRLGYIDVERNPRDRRTIHLRLGAEGAAAMGESSVLEASRVRRLLAALSSDERRRALDGLSLLAEGARRIRATGADRDA